MGVSEGGMGEDMIQCQVRSAGYGIDKKPLRSLYLRGLMFFSALSAFRR